MRSIQQLRLVSALATHANFGRAAQALGMSQPALTKAIRAIELSLKAPLFDRGPPITPTHFGHLVLNHGVSVLTDLAELERELALAKGLDTGTLQISAGVHTVDIAVYPAVAALSRAYPFLPCRLNVSDNLRVNRLVRAGRADIGVGHIHPASQDPELDVELLRVTRYRTFCAAGHPLAGRTGLTIGDLLHYPWVAPRGLHPRIPPPPESDLPFGTYDPDTGIVSPRVSISTLPGIHAMIAFSEAISLAPSRTIAREVARGDVVVLDIDYPAIDLEYGFIFRRGRSFSPGVLAFMDQVRAVEAAIGPEN